MNIHQAIKILALNALEEGSYLPPDYIKALKLGIEALKRIYLQREHPKGHFNILLSGETE